MKKIIHLILLFAFISSCSNGNTDGSTLNTEKEITKDSLVVSDSRIGIKMKKVGGVYQIPCVVNGVKMNFIFDTGASNVCISMTEAMFLAKNDYLEDEDFIGRSQSQIADGSVVENMEINLHSLEIEGIMLTDVKAIVVKSLDAPLLLGQSALKKLGKIEIDGDSLFIIKKGEKKQVVKKATKTQDQDLNALVEPEEYWYDAILAKLGYNGKIEEYLGAAWAAYENDLPELAYSYCDKALNLRETAKAYGLKGYFYYKQYETLNDGSEDYHDIVENASQNLDRYYELNKNKNNFSFPSGINLYYDSLVFCLGMSKSYNYEELYRKQLNRGWKTAFHYGEYDMVIDLGQELYLRNSQNVHAMSMLGRSYTRQRKYDLAEKWAKKILETHIDDSKAYSCLADMAKEQGRYSEAIRYYEKCIEIDNEDAKVLNNMAIIYWKMSLYDDGDERYGEKWDAMRAYAVYLWQKAARLGEPHAKRNLKKKGYEW